MLIVTFLSVYLFFNSIGSRLAIFLNNSLDFLWLGLESWLLTFTDPIDKWKCSEPASLVYKLWGQLVCACVCMRVCVCVCVRALRESEL